MTDGTHTSHDTNPLTGLSEAQIRDLIKQAQTELESRSQRHIEQLKQLAKEAGYEVTLTRIGEPIAGHRRRRSRGHVQPKYANPNQPGQTWAGRGRKPRWMEQELARGRSMDDFAISQQPHSTSGMEPQQAA